MSGGVDSSAVAALLHSQGQPIVGLTMQLWNQRRLPELQTEGAATGRCCSIDDVYDARAVASQIGIPYYVVNFEDRFEAQVVKPFVEEYLAGRTPIPCTLCNNFVKFDQFLDMAAGVGAEKIATGHYARIRFDEVSQRWQLLRAEDATKDQTYFLWGLTQHQLSKTLFPLGEMAKADVRDMARGLGVRIHDKPDSQEICFVPNGDYAGFIAAYTKEQGRELGSSAGELVTTTGEIVGKHQGTHRFTVGQRRGLGVAAGEPLYVISTEPATHRVVIGKDADLLRTSFDVSQVNWVSIDVPAGPIRAEVRIRNRHMPSAATITPIDETRASIAFDTSQRAITPGQAAVFYSGDVVLGGGWID